jgi:transposase, IS5 family
VLRVVRTTRLIGVIAPPYPKSGRVGRQPIGVPKMLRMYRLRQWYGSADEALEDALYDSQALRDFVGINLSRESVRDACRRTTTPRALFEQINAHLSEQGPLMRAGTIVDATIIAAPARRRIRAWRVTPNCTRP